MDGNREKIVERIKKLLSVTEERGATENEAIAAALQAQKLIVTHDVNDFEIYGEDEPEIVSVASEWKREKSWRGLLANVIADNFRCKSYRSCRDIRKGKSAGREARRVFYGYDMDANAALLTFEKLVEVGERLASAESRKARKMFGTAVGVENNFLIGFTEGVRVELEKQSQALLVVTPPEVIDGYEDIKAGFSGRKARHMSLRPDYFDIRDQGFAAGRDSIRASRLGATDAHLLA